MTALMSPNREIPIEGQANKEHSYRRCNYALRKSELDSPSKHYDIYPLSI